MPVVDVEQTRRRRKRNTREYVVSSLGGKTKPALDFVRQSLGLSVHPSKGRSNIVKSDIVDSLMDWVGGFHFRS